MLTHYGQAVGEMDRFDEVQLSDEEELAEGEKWCDESLICCFNFFARGYWGDSLWWVYEEEAATPGRRRRGEWYGREYKIRVRLKGG